MADRRKDFIDVGFQFSYNGLSIFWKWEDLESTKVLFHEMRFEDVPVTASSPAHGPLVRKVSSSFDKFLYERLMSEWTSKIMAGKYKVLLRVPVMVFFLWWGTGSDILSMVRILQKLQKRTNQQFQSLQEKQRTSSVPLDVLIVASSAQVSPKKFVETLETQQGSPSDDAEVVSADRFPAVNLQ